MAGCGSGKTIPTDPGAVRNALVGTIWNCESLFRREVRGNVPLTLEFLADGTVRGNGGCNDFSGPYSLNGENLTFGQLTSTKKTCGPAADEQEYTYLSFLPTITKVKVDGDEMELFKDTDPEPMVFGSQKGGGLFW